MKLTTLLTTSYKITATEISHLIIITGDVRNRQSVQSALFSDTANKRAVDIIISGIGTIPIRKGWNPISEMEDPTVYFNGISVILSVLKDGQIVGQPGPHLVTIGTTGISKLGRDYPLLVLPINKWLLHVAHQDKGKMEDLVARSLAAMGGTDGESGNRDGVLGGHTIIHTSILTSGEMLGKDRMSSAIEGSEWSGDAIGYTISRRDVGNWIFEVVVSRYGSK